MSSSFADKMSEAGSTSSYVKQQDWERKVNSLDKQEKEVHQTQLKLIRDQTMAFVRDLTNLRHEVAAQKVTVDMLQSTFDREKQDRDASVQSLVRRTQASQLDMMMPMVERTFQDQVQVLELKLRQDLAQEVNLRKTESESFVQQLGTETAAREQSQRLADEATKVIHDKLQEVDETIEKVKQSLDEKVAAAEAAAEASHADFQARHNEHHRRLDDLVQKSEKQHGDHSSRVAELMQQAATKHVVLSQLMEDFKTANGKALEEIQAEWKEHHVNSQHQISELQEATMNEFNDYQQQQRSQGRKWEAHHVSIEERLDSVETSLIEYVDKQVRDLEAAHNRLGDLQLGQAALSRDKDALRSSGTALSERLECLEQALGGMYAPWSAPGQTAPVPGAMRSRAGSWRLVNRSGSPPRAGNEMQGRPGPQTRPPFHRPGERNLAAGNEEASLDRDLIGDNVSSPDHSNSGTILPSVADRLDELERSTKGRLQERLDYLEGMVTEEHQRLWQAIDNHTHDLSHQVLKKKADSPDASRSVEMTMPSSPLAAFGGRSTGFGSQTISEPVGSQVTMSPCGSRLTSVRSVGLLNTTVQFAAHERSVSPEASRSPHSQGNWSPVASVAMMPSPVSANPYAAACLRDKEQPLPYPMPCGTASAVTTIASSGVHLPFQHSQTVTRTGSPCTISRTVSPSQSTRSSLQPAQRPALPWPWPAPPQLPGNSFGSLAEEEVERISCGRARYSGEKSTVAEVSMS